MAVTCRSPTTDVRLTNIFKELTFMLGVGAVDFHRMGVVTYQMSETSAMLYLS